MQSKTKTDHQVKVILLNLFFLLSFSLQNKYPKKIKVKHQIRKDKKAKETKKKEYNRKFRDLRLISKKRIIIINHIEITIA